MPINFFYFSLYNINTHILIYHNKVFFKYGYYQLVDQIFSDFVVFPFNSKLASIFFVNSYNTSYLNLLLHDLNKYLLLFLYSPHSILYYLRVSNCVVRQRFEKWFVQNVLFNLLWINTVCTCTKVTIIVNTNHHQNRNISWFFHPNNYKIICCFETKYYHKCLNLCLVCNIEPITLLYF